jgi:hypothetical protein
LVDGLMDSVATQVALLKEQLTVLTSNPLEETTAQLTQHEAAKLHVAIAYTLASLYYILKRSSGDSASSMARVNDEISRIKSYVAKLNAIETNKKRSRIDSEAATRMISHQLS